MPSKEKLVKMGSYRVLKLQPNDRVVLECREPMSMKQLEDLKEHALLAFPGHQVVVLPTGVRLRGVLRRADRRCSKSRSR